MAFFDTDFINTRKILIKNKKQYFCKIFITFCKQKMNAVEKGIK